jgi:hypothetical protein
MPVVSSDLTAPRGRQKRVLLAVVLNVLLLCVIGCTFYVQDYRYSLPTPRPIGFVGPTLNKAIPVPHADGRPTLLCFASPDCGCSRFNQDHLWELSREFGSSVRIIEVIEGPNSDGLTSPGETWIDSTGEFARKCGIYSTPQAVVLNQRGILAFSGNFNSTRFCADPQSQFVRIALEAVVARQPIPRMPLSATTPYGCAIPRGRSDK